LEIAADDPNRIKNRPDIIYPLVDADITEEQAFGICEKYNLLSPAYDEQTRRLGCWFCHNQRIGELKKIRKKYPKFWELMLKLDRDSLCTFKPDWTVAQLERRFEQEDRQITIFDYCG
jgi:hypothetical protein